MADHPETIWLEPVCERCKSDDDFDGILILQEYSRETARCELPGCHNEPIEYIRADILTAIIDEITQNCEEFDTNERREMMETIAENKRLKAELDRLKADIETPRERRGFS